MTAPAGEQQQEGQADIGKAAGQDKGTGGDERSFTQSQLNAIVAQARRDTEAKFDGFDDLKSKAEQLDQLTAASKSELQTANDSAAEFKSKFETEQGTNKRLQAQLLRQQIGAKEKLDPDLWDRVTGDTAEEIEADVKKLVTKFGTTGGGRPSKGLQSGASAPDGATAKDRAAAALRGLGKG